MNKKTPEVDLLISFFNEKFGLAPEEIQSLLGADIRHFQKGDIFLKVGQHAEKCYFVIKGCVRQYYYDDNGRDISVNFYTEFEPISLEKTTSGENLYYLECIEDTFITTDDTQRTEALYQSFPNIESISRQITEQNLTAAQKRMKNLLSMKPEERYLDFIATKPDLIQKVPQHQLASYLGIQPESLSRIKKRLADKRKN